MSELFFTEQPITGTIRLSEEEARHLVKVLRHETGDTIYFTDGKGTLYEAELVNTHYSDCTAAIKQVHRDYRKRPYRLQVGIAPTKNMDRFEWFLEKATEIGIDAITPIICNRSERRELRIDRLQKILISAMKQSFQTQLPKINEPVAFLRFLEGTASQKFICHLDTEHPRHIKEVCKPASDVLLLIGPEGDFTPDELTAAIKTGFTCVSLGGSRLRTETAGIMACAALSLLNQ